MEKKLAYSIAANRNLQEQVAALMDELKKAKGSQNYYLDKITKLESGETVTQQASHVITSEFFSSEAYRNAQIDNFISSGNFFLAHLVKFHFCIYITLN